MALLLLQQFLNKTHMNIQTKLNSYAALIGIFIIALSWGLINVNAATTATFRTSSTSQTTGSSTSAAAAPVGGSCTEQDKQLSEITTQVNQLQAEKDAVDKATDIISAEATRFKNLLATSTTATSTATTTTATSTVSNTGGSAFSLSLNPNTIHPGDNFTVNVNINSSSVQKYSINVYQGSSLVGTLLGGAIPDSSSRPTYVQKVFQISAGAPTGTYTVKISDDNNSSVFQTATLIVTTNQNSYSQAQSNAATTNQTNTNTTVTTSNGMSVLTFANPFAYGILPRDKNTQITWTAQGNTTAPVNLYLKTSCVKNIPICSQNSPNNPTSSCVKIKSSCKTGSSKTVSIGTVPASQGSYNWVIPHSVVDTAGVIYAEQNGQRVGSTGRFYVSY